MMQSAMCSRGVEQRLASRRWLIWPNMDAPGAFDNGSRQKLKKGLELAGTTGRLLSAACGGCDGLKPRPKRFDPNGRRRDGREGVPGTGAILPRLVHDEP